VVRVALDPAGVVPAGQAAEAGALGERHRDHGRVDVDARQVDLVARRRVLELVRRRRPALLDLEVVPAVAEDRARPEDPGPGADLGQDRAHGVPGEREVDAAAQQRGLGDVRVGVDERGQHQRVPQVDDP
jgi:hypothetical protein